MGVAALLLCGGAAAAESPFPTISGETLTGKALTLPAAVAGKPAIICIGFSHASSGAVTKWAEAARREIPAAASSIYTVAVLQDAPRFVRPMAVHGMKSQTPVERRDHFLVIYSGEQSLKEAVHFSDSSSAYVALLDGAGRIQWTHSGLVFPTGVEDLKDKFNMLIRSKPAN